MNAMHFISTLAVGLATLLAWGFRVLPRERWQVLAAVPVARDATGGWRGVNFTYYGLFTALGLVVAVALASVLLGSIGATPMGMLLIVGLVCAVCIPAATLVARIVERKRNVFTVGGAAFVGVLLIPWAVRFANRLLPDAPPIPVVPAFAAIAIAYAFGEAVGRLACISYGCCYGKSLADVPAWLRRGLARWCFTFDGKTKKIAYVAGLEGQPVAPIQAMTSIVFACGGLMALGLFLAGHFAAALGTAATTTLLWRAISETLRADWRGGGHISVYQWMSLSALGYVTLMVRLFPAPQGTLPDLSIGLNMLWNPAAILGLQALGLVEFIHAGRSVATGSTIAFHLNRERI